jgi:catalase
MKFPDLVHAVKPEPHHAMPQAASAHDTFWDFVSLMPESTHMLMWAMSDRAIPRSYRMMEGFGVHTFKLVNADGEVRLVKFHWKPKLGTHALLWDEAQELCGRDADFHRRDLWESIEAGAFPEFELGVQVMTEEQALALPFDVLDATKLVPEEMVPVTPLGRLVLDRNPDNFFAETEQVAFHPGHVVPGIDFTNDPLLQGRLFSYTDTQLIRLGGPNFHQIPVNRPQCPFHNLQRDGHMQQSIPKGRVAYEPASLDDGAPGQARDGFVTAVEASGDKVRARPALFADRFSQATLFWASQDDVEKTHIVDAFAFELGKVETLAVRQRMVDMLGNVDEDLAAKVGAKLRLVPGTPPVERGPFSPPIEHAPSLSLHDTDYPSATRKVAILVADGVDAAGVTALKTAIEAAGGVAKIVAPEAGDVSPARGKGIAVDHRLATVASVLFDALAIPGGAASIEKLGATPGLVPFLAGFHRHLKPVWLAPEANDLYEEVQLGVEGMPGITVGGGAKAIDAFARSLARRFHDRKLPPAWQA